MRIPSLLIATAVLGTATWAQDESPYYAQLGFGGVFTEDASGVPGGTIGFDPGFSFSGALGRRFPLSSAFSFDLEGEVFYQSFTVDETDILAIPSAVNDDATTLAFMGNGILNWHFTPQYSIYGGLGLGFAKRIAYDAWDSGSLSQLDTDGLAFQARLGMAYNMGGSYTLQLGYRYFKTEPVDIEDGVQATVDELDVAQHSVEAVLRWGL